MKDLISIFIILVIAGYMFYTAYTLRVKTVSLYTKPDGMKEWHDIKYGNGFIVLHWSEIDRWELASVKEKCVLIANQQKLIKDGIIKIVRENGERRLIFMQDYKRAKNDRQAKD